MKSAHTNHGRAAAHGVLRAARVLLVCAWFAGAPLPSPASAATPGASFPAAPRADSVQCNLPPSVTEDGHRFTIRCYRGPGTQYYVSAEVCGPGHCSRQGTNVVPYGEYATTWSTGFFTGKFQAFAA